MRGLYVDWNVDKVIDPVAVSQDEARSVIGLLNTLNGFVEQNDLSLLAENVAEIDITGQFETMVEQFKSTARQLEAEDPEHAEERMRDLVDNMLAMMRQTIPFGGQLESSDTSAEAIDQA